MELSFAVDGGKSWVLTGELLSTTSHIAPDSFPTADFEFQITDFKIVEGREATPIVKLTPSKGPWVRVGDATACGITYRAREKSICNVTLYVAGIYNSYEDAASAEMKSKMER